jgi:hypothetical protein
VYQNEEETSAWFPGFIVKFIVLGYLPTFYPLEKLYNLDRNEEMIMTLE